MSNKINFEVMVLQGGRWEVHASYPYEQQGQAIKDAKALENISTIKGVKVVREETNETSGETKENNIYASSNLADEQPLGAQEAKLARKSGTAAELPSKKGKAKSKNKKPGNDMRSGKKVPKHIEEYDPDAADKITFSFFRLIVRLLMVVLFSAIIASIVSGLGGIWLGETEFRASTQANILYILFFGTFLLSVVWMSFSFLSKAKIASSNSQRTARARPEPKPKPEKPAIIVKQTDRVDFGEDTNKMAEETKIADENEKAEKAEKAARDGETSPTGQDGDTLPEPGSAAKDVTEAETSATPKDGVAEIGAATEDAPWLKKQKTYIMGYLTDSLKSANSNKADLDNFNKFGVNLFIAGAIETLSQSRSMDGNTASQVLSEAVKSMGFRQRDADAFPDKIQGYLLADSKYMQMYQAGRSSMMTHLEGDTEGAATLAAALTQWNKPKIIEKSSGPVTVLFTDIAGSTNMTQTLGDALAQQVVRAHNKVVRDALHKHNGKEIKHTGDGIMASFSKTSNGVEAAADMQKGSARHTAANPDLPLDLKIGINAGEPIAEDDDLFGTTVQMAARIVDKAQAGQIFVSDIVQGLCGGKNFKFIAHGGFEMKGFDGSVTLHELVWNQDAVAAPVATEQEFAPADPGVDVGGEIGAEIGTEIGSEIGADIKSDPPEEQATPENGQTEEPIEGEDKIDPAASQAVPETTETPPPENINALPDNPTETTPQPEKPVSVPGAE